MTAADANDSHLLTAHVIQVNGVTVRTERPETERPETEQPQFFCVCRTLLLFLTDKNGNKGLCLNEKV